ncbi:MAG: DUF1092 family protein [Leptolyngbya sp. SIO1D8]|nr:DUF1092 family protein [Leptolyngbya sp. SIO1D8]
MVIWEADLYRRPLQDEAGQLLWELLVCDTAFQFTYGAMVAQSDVNADWVQQQLQTVLQKSAQHPTEIRVFRPQTVSLLQAGAHPLDLCVRPMRYTPTLKQWLVQRSRWYPSQPNFSDETYDPLALDQPAPVPIPEALWGEQWRFGSLSAQDFQESLIYEPIPVQAISRDWLPLQIGLASTTTIPGMIIDAGRLALALAQWLQAQQPAALTYIPGAPDGVLLEAGLVERWVLNTFEDEQVKAAARTFRDRQQQAQGLHFLLVRPDDSGMTFTGLWLLRQ